ncbi:unnamed protein product [Moneuplotes crassus]|uniref:Uncharacterized protein n=1 Tax=Euplotes crassus TaxID=5936 RepID=A0AAD1X674_EUPCR|nr:unnamed protein product [Moneuplotes crassus]
MIKKEYQESCLNWEEDCEYYKEIIQDLKESINLLLNEYLKPKETKISFTKFYNKITDLRKEKCSLKKAYLIEKHKFYSLSKAIDSLSKSLEHYKKDCNKSEKGMLFKSNTQLKQTINDLTEEIESLSLENQQLIEDLEARDFYAQYNKVKEELDRLKQEQEILIDIRFEDCQTVKKVNIPTLSVPLIKEPITDISAVDGKNDVLLDDVNTIKMPLSSRKPNIEGNFLSKDKAIPLTKIDIMETRGLYTIYPNRSQASSSCGRKKKSVKITQKNIQDDTEEIIRESLLDIQFNLDKESQDPALVNSKTMAHQYRNAYSPSLKIKELNDSYGALTKPSVRKNFMKANLGNKPKTQTKKNLKKMKRSVEVPAQRFKSHTYNNFEEDKEQDSSQNKISYTKNSTSKDSSRKLSKIKERRKDSYRAYAKAFKNKRAVKGAKNTNKHKKATNWSPRKGNYKPTHNRNKSNKEVLSSLSDLEYDQVVIEEDYTLRHKK